MIGVFDSGVGGLSVVKQIFKNLPQYQIIYFGDTVHLPYGTKGAGFVRKSSENITKWLLEKEAKIIVIACHTASAEAADYLKKEFKEIPVFEMIGPALKEIILGTKNKRIGIIGTPGTIKSEAWEKKLLALDPSLKIYSKSCPLFVPLVEEGWINKEITKKIIKEYLKDFKNIETLVLACTHYPMLKSAIKKVVGNKVKIIDPAESLARELKIFLDDNPQIEKEIKKGSNHEFFFSDQPYNLKRISKLCLKEEIKPKIISYEEIISE